MGGVTTVEGAAQVSRAPPHLEAAGQHAVGAAALLDALLHHGPDPQQPGAHLLLRAPGQLVAQHHLADRQPRLAAARQQLRARRERVANRAVVRHDPPLPRLVLVEHEATADRVVLPGRDLRSLRPKGGEAHSIGVERKSLASVQDDVRVHVEGHGVPCEQVEAAGLAHALHRRLRRRGVDVLRRLAEETEHHGLDAAVAVAGGAEEPNSSPGPPPPPRAARPSPGRSRRTGRPASGPTVCELDGPIPTEKRSKTLSATTGPRGTRARVDDPVGEVARERGPHQDPEVGGRAVPHDEHHTGEREQGLQAGSLRRDARVQVGGAAVREQVAGAGTAAARSSSAARTPRPPHRGRPPPARARRAGRSGRPGPRRATRPDRATGPRPHQRRRRCRFAGARPRPAPAPRPHRPARCRVEAQVELHEPRQLAHLNPGGRGPRSGMRPKPAGSPGGTGTSSQPSRRLPSLSKRTLSVTVTGTTSSPMGTYRVSTDPLPARARPAPARTSGRARRCDSSR